jgi:signal transduction histidine kinase
MARPTPNPSPGDGFDDAESQRLLEPGGPRPSPPPPGFRGTRLAYLGALAGGLAHEIKNPLSTMALNLSMLREDWQNPQTTREQRTLKKIELLEKEVNRLEGIVQNFLSFARGDRYQFELLDMNEIVREVLEFSEAENQRANIRVHADLRGGLPFLSLDRNQFKQVVINLVNNARQAMPQGGELLLRSWQDGEYVTLEITDTGVGMSPEVRERCWELFFSTRKGGTGYGLPLTKRILEEHGAEIDVWSEPGRGTRFTIRIPVPGSAASPSPVVNTTFVEVEDRAAEGAARGMKLKRKRTGNP